ncbi:Clp protease N-terminal domain-containing protein [Ornithinimicrobium pratense]|uniref:Clp R domain-containing protein n=1 Tax=Ornithinimicrobium pratense TaxID=2593973 RepID=A0A5J6V4C6_9MICO|nr:Clp protease N-terminal domain-containing protein [Ornithinimicrobium pratense]QFG68578.1 hypothetical protein FY030_07480 [Ornithinimicrobium pratense]
MSRFGTILTLSQAAWQECALLGHREIDVEHVLLATMDDGDVAEILGRHGVTREGTRQHVDAVVRDQLASLGVDLGETSLSERRPVTDLHHQAVGALETSGRAQQLLSEGRTVPGVLLATLDLPDGTATHLLERQGADVAAVRLDVVELLERSRSQPRAAGTVDMATLPDSHLIDGRPGIRRRRTRFYAVPWPQAWEQVSTAAGARAWLLSDGSTQVAGPGELRGELSRGRSGARRGSYQRRLLAAEPPDGSTPGHALWQEHWVRTRRRPWGRERSGPGQWVHLTVIPADGGTRVDLVLGTVRHGRTQAVLRPVIPAAQAIASRNALYQLGLVLEDADGASSRA